MRLVNGIFMYMYALYMCSLQLINCPDNMHISLTPSSLLLTYFNPFLSPLDPYVKLYLYYKGSREAKWKSSVKKKTLVPIYNESFRFDISDKDIHFVRMDLIVMDHDVFGRNDTMGVVQLGEGSDHTSGRLHWTEMISSPRNPISRWHSLDKPVGTLLKRMTTKSLLS